MSEPAARAGKLGRFEWACLGVVGLAFLFRVGLILQPDIIWDSAWYLLLARSFAEHGAFVMPWFDPPLYNGYWPPLFPIFVSPLVALLGPSYHVLVLGSVLATALLTLGVFLMTRDMMGRTRAFAAAALVAANPAFFTSDSRGMSESLLALMVALTVWAFLKSLDKPKWLPVAGAFAFLAYLGKASLGLPFVAVGVAALVGWRVWTRGWKRVVTSPWDVGVAVAGVLALGALALTRGPRLGGVGLGLIEPLARAVADGRWPAIFVFKLVFAAAFLLVVALPLSMRVADALRGAKREREGALWLATLLPLAAGAVFTTSFYITEKRSLVDFDNIRYLTPSIVPFLWLLLPHWPFESETPDPPGAERMRVRRRHQAWFLGSMALVGVVLLLNPMTGTGPNGQGTLGRLLALGLLLLVPLVLSVFAIASRYEVAARRTVKGETVHRYVEAPGQWGAHALAIGVVCLALLLAWMRFVPDLVDETHPSALVVAGLISAGLAYGLWTRDENVRTVSLVATGVLLAFYFSAWYLTVILGLLVALGTASPRGRVVGMAFAVLCATAPGFHTPYPIEAAAADIDHLLPPGTVLGAAEPIVYVGAVIPADVTLRLTDLPPGPGIDAILVTNQDRQALGGGPPGFVEVETWNYTFAFSPTLQARIWFEDKVLGDPSLVQEVTALGLWVREGSPLAAELLPATRSG